MIVHCSNGPITLLLPSPTTADADANETSKFLNLCLYLYIVIDYFSCTLVCWVNVLVVLRLLRIYLVGQKVYVLTSKIASADLVAPLSLTTCLPMG